MICIAYFSSATAPMSGPALSGLLAQAQQNNRRDGATGLLCHCDGGFLQFLEGDGRGGRGSGAHPAGPEAPRRAGGASDGHPGAPLPRLSMGVVRVGEIGAAQQAFCRSLRHIDLAAGPDHHASIAPNLQSFRAWLR